MPLNIPLNIKLHSGQQYVHDNSRKYTLLKCGKRWGKTKLALYRLLVKAGATPNGTCWYVAPTYRQAKQIAWRELLQLLPPQMIRRKIETDLYMELWNGCLIQLIGADDEDHLRGVKINHLVMDEAAYCKEYVWPLLQGQLLGNVESGTADLISSPNKTGTNWFSGMYEDAKKKMASGNPEWAAFFYTIWDNPTLPQSDIQKLKDGTPDDTWSLEYMAQESEFAGTKYAEFSYENHVVAFDEKENSRFPTYRALDYGLLHPTVCLWAKVNKEAGWIHVYDEFFRNGLIIQEICNVIKEKTGDTPIQLTVIDPSANRRDIITGRSLKDEFARCGVGCIDGDRRGADNIGGRGVSIVKMMLKRNMVRVSPKCKNLVLELQNLQWGQKEGDDATDALRYLLIYLHDTVFHGNLISTDTFSPAPNKVGIFNMNDFIFDKSKGNSNDRSWANCSDEFEEVA